MLLTVGYNKIPFVDSFTVIVISLGFTNSSLIGAFVLSQLI